MTIIVDREGAFVDLYRSHYGQVLAFAWRRTDEATARDVTAETFTVAWRRLDEAAARGLPWLYLTARLVLSNHQRGERRLRRLLGRLAAQPREPDVPDPAGHHAEHQAVLDALRRLSPSQREVFLLVAWEQLDVTTAAEVAGCSPAAAAVRLHRAQQRLRGLLSPPTAAAQTVLPTLEELS